MREWEEVDSPAGDDISDGKTVNFKIYISFGVVAGLSYTFFSNISSNCSSITISSILRFYQDSEFESRLVKIKEFLNITGTSK